MTRGGLGAGIICVARLVMTVDGPVVKTKSLAKARLKREKEEIA